MKRLILTLAFFTCSNVLACPQAKTMFNGAVPATIYGLNPFCGEQGQYWVNAYSRVFRASGAQVNYVETYKAYAASSDEMAKMARSVQTLLNTIDYRYEGSEDLDDGGAVLTFHKANTTRRHIALILKPMTGFMMFAFINMDMPYEHTWEDQYEH